MKRFALWLSPPILAINLLACTEVVVEEPRSSAPLRQASVVSTSAATFNPKPGDTVLWADGISVHAPKGVEIDKQLVETLRSEIDSELVAKGYRFAENGTDPTYLVHGVMVLGNELNEKQLRDLLGFEPGLVVNDQKYEKGSLLLLLVNPRSAVTEWRSVVQVLTTGQLEEGQRNARLQYVVHSLLRPLPILNGAASQ